jgi:hypothetical protein
MRAIDDVVSTESFVYLELYKQLYQLGHSHRRRSHGSRRSCTYRRAAGVNAAGGPLLSSHWASGQRLRSRAKNAKQEGVNAPSFRVCPGRRRGLGTDWIWASGVTRSPQSAEDRSAGFVRIRELLRLDSEYGFPQWHPRAGDKGSPRLFVFGCPRLTEQVSSAPVEEDDEPLPRAAVSQRWEQTGGGLVALLAGVATSLWLRRTRRARPGSSPRSLKARRPKAHRAFPRPGRDPRRSKFGGGRAGPASLLARGPTIGALAWVGVV